MKCFICPRKCGVDRDAKQGYCGEMNEIRLALACLHFGEEPPITAGVGSGTLFFTGCNLRCAFCQNYQISQCHIGRAVSQDEFVNICLALQDAGAANINLVTASHIVPRLVGCLAAARQAGLTIPYCWNSSAYECVETLEMLKAYVTVWLPDLKTLSATLSRTLFCAADYGDVATRAVQWMIDNNPLRFDGERMTSGVIVRHLFLPGHFEETCDVLDWLHIHASGRAIVSLMSQYTPVPFAPDAESPADRAHRDAALAMIENRLVNNTEDRDLRDIIEAYNFRRAYYQDLSDDSSWLPDFRNVHSFPNSLSRTIWHWQTGFTTNH